MIVDELIKEILFFPGWPKQKFWAAKSTMDHLCLFILVCACHPLLNPPCLAGACFRPNKTTHSAIKISKSKCVCVHVWTDELVQSQYHVYQLPIVGLSLSPNKYYQYFHFLWSPFLNPQGIRISSGNLAWPAIKHVSGFPGHVRSPKLGPCPTPKPPDFNRSSQDVPIIM